jgi:hypothetical protein
MLDALLLALSCFAVALSAVSIAGARLLWLMGHSEAGQVEKVAWEAAKRRADEPPIQSTWGD